MDNFQTEFNALTRKYNICSICMKNPRYRGTRCQKCFNYKQKIDRLKEKHLSIIKRKPFTKEDVVELEASMKEYHNLVLSRKASY